MEFYQLAYFIQISRVLALLLVIWAWAERGRSGGLKGTGIRKNLLIIAMALATLGVTVGLLLFLLPAKVVPEIRIVAVCCFLVGFTALILALLGKGKGRLLAALASFLLALSWLPFVLP